MALSSTHPLYTEFLVDWQTMRDTYRGQRIVKEKGFLYLPATSGMEQDGLKSTRQEGSIAYNAYRTRAHYPDLVSSAIQGMLGVMHRKPPTIELPSSMELLLEKITLEGESIPMLLQRINEEQLVTGRLGLLVDMPEEPIPGHDLPYIAMYQAETVLNWDAGRRDGIEVENLNMVVLDESENERVADFEWEFIRKYRVLILGDVDVNEPTGDGIYRVGVFREEAAAFNEADLIEPNIRGRKLNFIPFTFINSKDIVPEPDNPPLLGMANQVLTIYRGEADYRQGLFMQGQDTLIVIGGQDEESYRTGANASMTLPQGADAKYIGVDSAGLPEMRTALENDYNRAAQAGGQLMDSVSRERESGDALKVRVAARTATLNQIALSGAFGLQQSLRQIAIWTGANPEEVIVIPNLDFVDDTMTGKELTELMASKSMGAPLSLESIHLTMQNRGVTEKSLEEEVEAIETELVLIEDMSGTTNSDGPEEDVIEDDDT